jgi:prepilin-type N-terminal cleavage/methylation domain-containing protein
MLREVLVPSVSGRQYARGFALLEVVIASGVIAVIAAGSSVVVSMAIHASRQSRARTIATALASAKLEQLRSLSWTHVTTTGPAISMSSSDVTTDLSNDPATDDGRGLLASPPGTLTSNVEGYVDYLDSAGRWVGRGLSAPAPAVYIRRWAVQPLASHPDDLLVLEVVVGTRGVSGVFLPDMVRLVTIEARQ